MISMEQAQKGAIKFIENEVTSQMNGWQKLVAETAIGLYMSKIPEKIKALMSHPIAQDMGIMKDGMIDVDAVYAEASKHFTTPITVPIPVLGNIQFTKEDLELLYTYLTTT